MKTFIGILKEKAETHPQRKLFFSGPPEFDRCLTVSEIYQRVQSLALSLRDLGLRPGATVGILAPSTPEWEIAQYAILMAGGLVVGFDLQDSHETYAHIIAQCEIEIVFVGTPILFDKLPKIDGKHKPIKVIHLGAPGVQAHDQEAWTGPWPQPDSPATIIFTSGTTGEPKGIQYSQGQLVYAAECFLKAFPEILQGSRTACWLPLSNMFQRITNLCTLLIDGEIYFVENPLTIVDHLPRISPNVFIAVPRFYEKIYGGIQNKVAESSWLRRMVFWGALQVGHRYARALRKRRRPNRVLRILYRAFDKLVFQKLRGLFGGRIRFMISGSAPLRLELLEFYHAIGLLILEAYGTSENAIPNACNRYSDYKLGSVGKPLVEGSISISQEGEVWVKGFGVFAGYYKEEKTDKLETGYYKTGDLGHFDEEGYLHLTGRKSDFFKTSSGLKIPTSAIQDCLQQVPWVDASVALGESRKIPVALISLDFQSFSSHLGVPLDRIWVTNTGKFSSAALGPMESELREKLLEIPKKFRPAGILVLPRKITAQEKELTPNMKLRRVYIEQKFSKTLDLFYQELEGRPSKTPIWVLDPEDIQTVDYELAGLSSGVFRRAKSVTGLLFRSFISYVRFRVWGGSPEDVQRQIGRILREGLGGLKGPLQKVGQMLSYTAEQLPDCFKEEMRGLVHDSAPVNPYLIRSIVEAELGKPIPLLFREWRDRPLATGSIGQIHLARLPDGQQVVVKVLLPGIEKIVQSDMLMLRLALPFLGLVLKNGNLRTLIEELRFLISAECDLAQEADTQALMGKLYGRRWGKTPLSALSSVDVIIPKVFRNYCTKKILVAEYIEGMNFDEFKQSATQEEKNKAAEIIWRFNCSSITRYCLFNADPHPGNYVFVKGQVAFLDFGFSKRWPSSFIENWNTQTLAICQGDFEAFCRVSEKLGLRKLKGQINFRTLYDVHRTIFSRPWMKDEEFQFDQNYMRIYLTNLFQSHFTDPGLIVPKQFVALTRLYWGLFAVMAELHAKANFHRMTIPYLLEKPALDFGEEVS